MQIYLLTYICSLRMLGLGKELFHFRDSRSKTISDPKGIKAIS